MKTVDKQTLFGICLKVRDEESMDVFKNELIHLSNIYDLHDNLEECFDFLEQKSKLCYLTIAQKALLLFMKGVD